jgi:hypothetical protein
MHGRQKLWPWSQLLVGSNMIIKHIEQTRFSLTPPSMSSGWIERVHDCIPSTQRCCHLIAMMLLMGQPASGIPSVFSAATARAPAN